MENETEPAVSHDRAQLATLQHDLDAVKPAAFTKYQKLLSLLREAGIGDKKRDERIVIFSERIPTLKFLEERLSKDLKLGKKEIEIFHGTLDDQDQKRLVKDFGTRSTPVRVLLASDAASEGINLHFFCHRMIHFDLPWSLITLNQRNGRIDRYGQKHRPQIGYLLTVPESPDLKGDLRVLERLIEREDAANKNLGDVAWLMGLHTAESEEEHIAEAIEGGQDPEVAIPDEPQHTDFMDLLLGDDGHDEPAPAVNNPLTLYASDLAYARDAFDETLENGAAHLHWHDHLDGFDLSAPEDLLRRCEYLPSELKNTGWNFKLTTDRKRVMTALADSREDETRWPEWQLFWELHPVAAWLNDRVLSCFQRHEAPVLRFAKGLDRNERVVVFQAVLSNKRSQPILVDWFGVGFKDGKFDRIAPMQQLAEATGLRNAVPNRGGGLDEALEFELQAALVPAVEQAKTHMQMLRNERMNELAGPLRDGLRRLRRWKERKAEGISKQRSLFKEMTSVKARMRKLDVESAEAEKLYEERVKWIEEGMRTVEAPYLRIAAVLIHEGA